MIHGVEPPSSLYSYAWSSRSVFQHHVQVEVAGRALAVVDVSNPCGQCAGACLVAMWSPVDRASGPEILLWDVPKHFAYALLCVIHDVRCRCSSSPCAWPCTWASSAGPGSPSIPAARNTQQGGCPWSSRPCRPGISGACSQWQMSVTLASVYLTLETCASVEEIGIWACRFAEPHRRSPSSSPRCAAGFTTTPSRGRPLR